MSQQADRHRLDRSFSLGDFVFLKLQPYRQATMRLQAHHKLTPKYYGPFQVLDRIKSTAYKIDLPASASVLDVVLVSLLKLYKNSASASIVSLPSSAAAPTK